ncbi:uncharacterized protein PV07_01391 [Cladophialophora immunda]|uniref:Nephrocystin 3-like N-terminal domain-containing protein n=1 Tax=Cladophialophora immunda TaxID=569365 RepID=A0A0D2A2W5_9EURO|nr:uncharacterized protein PV07_01391 [Cladophialophora immunda]KIW34621.1 hypothetical protein PV07_01391 [Cladophialophora immunda]
MRPGKVDELTESLAQQMSNWLGKSVVSIDQKSAAAPGTCESIYSWNVWKDWEAAKCAVPLLLSGVTGVGKTTTAKSIRDRYLQRNGFAALSYFFDPSIEATITAKACVIYLLWQLCGQPSVGEFRESASLWHAVSPAFNTFRAAADCKFSHLLQILDAALELLGPFLLIVGSLDHCREGEDKDELIDYLVKLAARSNAQVILTSLTDIPLQRLGKEFSHIRLERNLVEPDIYHFVTDEINRTPKLHKLRAEILHAILKHSDGNFLHARLLIEDLKTSPNTTTLKAKMSSFASKVQAEYERLFTERNDQMSTRARERRDNILRLVLASKQHQKAEAISLFMAVDDLTCTINYENVDFEPAAEIVQLCHPFIQRSASDHVLPIHESAKLFLLQQHLAADQSDLFLARKCLAVLCQDQYRNPQAAVDLLKKHILEITTEGADGQPTTGDSSVYRYAALYFQEHVTAVSEPPDDLIEMLARFLRGTEYVTWSENLFDLKQQASFGGHLTVLSRLSTWRKFLPAPIQARIPLDDFFEQPHLRLAQILKVEFSDKLLQYLPLVRIGDFFNAGGQSTEAWQKAYDSKAMVVSGTTELLGSEDPIVLKFKASLLREYFWQKRFSEALQELLSLVESLRRVVGDENVDLYMTLWLLGWAYFCLSRFEESSDAYQEALRGLERLLGSSHRNYLMVQLYEGHRLEQLFLFGEAILFYSNIVEVLSPIVGQINGFVAMAQTALGAVQRKQGNYAEAQKNLFDGWGGRKQIFSINVNVCLDAAFQLALLLRDKGDGASCLELLEEVSNSSVLEQDFERRCQMVHIRSLVEFDNGEYDIPKFALLNLLDQATGSNRDRNNRELLWVRLTLADVMDKHGEDKDALMLFSELVEPREGDATQLIDEPEPPSQLRLARDALKLVRKAQLSESDNLLRANNLKWVRDSDFWILGEGGPVTDTAVIAPIKT